MSRLSPTISPRLFWQISRGKGVLLKNYIANIMLLLCIIFGTGCASVSRGFTTPPTQITSNPSGAQVTIDGITFGVTPLMVRLNPKRDAKVEINLPNYEPVAIMSMPGVDTGGRIAILGDIGAAVVFPPAILGLLYDGVKGAYKAHPALIDVPLRPR